MPGWRITRARQMIVETRGANGERGQRRTQRIADPGPTPQRTDGIGKLPLPWFFTFWQLVGHWAGGRQCPWIGLCAERRVGRVERTWRSGRIDRIVSQRATTAGAVFEQLRSHCSNNSGSRDRCHQLRELSDTSSLAWASVSSPRVVGQVWLLHLYRLGGR